MKKTVLLLALSFFLVTFLNAQNDCTGHTHADAAKALKKGVNFNGTNPNDCTNPGKTNYFTDSYSFDRFGRLMDSSLDSQQAKGKEIHSSVLGDIFSTPEIIVCCVPPPHSYDYEYTKALKDD